MNVFKYFIRRRPQPAKVGLPDDFFLKQNQQMYARQITAERNRIISALNQVDTQLNKLQKNAFCTDRRAYLDQITNLKIQRNKLLEALRSIDDPNKFWHP